ncbi:MAG: pyridoxamine 5'-phosphate oxidase family protein [Planctomycetes bacterium]|nr:pyridoxamine 5'-phosphate oxidase family protein [Planctomycetota bacterium]MBL7145027.1 pyridoxamine 5'-phosphate oxidase family protein [Phycisphaerae bacterium]
MSLTEYFDTAEGTGILATADSDGNVDLAIYARPHMTDDDTVVLVMSDKLSHANLQTNPKAAYMFIEKSKGYRGKRIYLQKIREENDAELIQSIRRRKRYDEEGEAVSGSSAVYFKVNKIRPLVGD